eukprot:scaffold132484_cov28-Attheya_sp.AAC.1
MFKELQSMPLNSENMKRGIKWPSAIARDNVLSIKHLATYNPKGFSTNIVIGMRHPVEWFESFYNFRALGRCNWQENSTTMPPPESMIGSVDKSFEQLYTDFARYELSIMQLGKFELDMNDIQLLAQFNLRTIQTPSKLFFYVLDQLDDKDIERSTLFKKDLQLFLGLKNKFPQFPHQNIIPPKTKFPGKIDICETPRFDKLRQILVINGKATSNWIKNKLVQGQDVTIGGMEHFLSLVDSWGSDPCNDH